MRKLSLLTNRLVCCLHSHFANLNFIGCSAYRLTSCTHVRTFVILLNTHSIILIQTILTGNCYNNRGPRINPLLIFGSAFVTYNLKLWRAWWSSLISRIDSRTVFKNFPVPREILMSSLTQPSSLMELCNPMWEQALSQWIVRLPFIQHFHHRPMMMMIMFIHLFILLTLSTSLDLIFTLIWLWVLWVPICILYLDLHLCTQVSLRMMLSYVHLFHTLHLLWTRNNPLTSTLDEGCLHSIQAPSVPS